MRYNTEMRQVAAIQYRRECAMALEWYHSRVAAIWVAFGRPSTNVECKAGLDATGESYKAMLRRSGIRYDVALQYAELAMVPLGFWRY